MFAIIRTGGKQYKVSKGDVILVERLDAEVGSSYTFDTILMVGNGETTLVGAPSLEKAKVVANVEKETRSDKIVVFKKKRRHTYRRKKGHRQYQTVLKITDIIAEGIKASSISNTVKTVDKESVKTKDAAPKKEKASSKSVKTEDVSA